MQLETQTNLPSQNPPPSTDQGTELTPLSVIRTETVLSKLPVHNLAKKGRVDIQINKTGPDGQVELKWEVSYSDRYGQARQLAYKLDTIVVDQRIDQQGRPLPERICLGSLNQIAVDLGLIADHGTTNQHLKRALRQNALAGITAKFKYRTNDGVEKILEATFTRYSVIFTGEKFADGTKADAVYIELNPTYREVLNNAPMRPLDLDYKKQLAPAAQRFYEIVSYKIFAALKNNQPLARLAYSEYCTFSAQQRYFTREQVQKQMYKIHVVHQQFGYITKVNYEPKTDEQGNPDWLMCYVPGPKARTEYATFTGKKLPRVIDAAQVPPAIGERPRRPRQRSLPLRPEVDSQALAALTGRGVTESQARKVLATLPTDFPILDTLEWADQQIAVQRGKITNPPGFYISLLQAREKPPATFTPSRVRKAQEEENLRKQQALQEEIERQEAQEEAQYKATETLLDRFKTEQPDAYRVLFDQVATEFFTEFPKLAQFGRREANRIYEGAIRSRMKQRLVDGWQSPEAATETSPPPALVEALSPMASFAAELRAILDRPQLKSGLEIPPAATQPEK